MSSLLTLLGNSPSQIRELPREAERRYAATFLHSFVPSTTLLTELATSGSKEPALLDAGKVQPKNAWEMLNAWATNSVKMRVYENDGVELLRKLVASTVHKAESWGGMTLGWATGTAWTLNPFIGTVFGVPFGAFIGAGLQTARQEMLTPQGVEEAMKSGKLPEAKKPPGTAQSTPLETNPTTIAPTADSTLPALPETGEAAKQTILDTVAEAVESGAQKVTQVADDVLKPAAQKLAVIV